VGGLRTRTPPRVGWRASRAPSDGGCAGRAGFFFSLDAVAGQAALSMRRTPRERVVSTTSGWTTCGSTGGWSWHIGGETLTQSAKLCALEVHRAAGCAPQRMREDPVKEERDDPRR
jgi:hypothetical protein